MKLKKLLNGIDGVELPECFAALSVESISCDSRDIQKNSLFVAVKGPISDGADFVVSAISKGAKIIAKEKGRGDTDDFANKDVCILIVKDSKKFLRDVLMRFYGDPSQKVRTIGITGTNGKTTISYLFESILRQAGKKCTVIGTVNYRLGGKVIPSKNTTPGIVDNQRYLSEMAREGIDYCVMEVSSHALDQGRVDAIDFKVGVFTNLTGDHLDYHKTMEEYFTAKALLFSRLSKDSCAVINIDDEYGVRLLPMTRANSITYALNHKADVTAENIVLNFSQTAFTLKTPQGRIPIQTKLIGRHNIYNILSAAAGCFGEGISLEGIRDGIENLSVVPGRLEQVVCGQDFNVFVDYAHTEDALKNVLTNLRAVSKAKIIVVFGCGGDRDKTKRPKMGRVAGRLADWCILTSDNPRSEDPQSILEQVTSGFQERNYEVISDREAAIKKALISAKKGDIVLIAGKGHETYQIFKDKTIDFDDREVVRNFFSCLR
ncbi:MAG TPA: UDP-N-acetylmuramoyl-L-alanyl-D-glutamate--2,6-diaminopimelate ligase [Candidatus Omnitrophota bacterium]|nr:UDP-N-acetylmuramoyl-L-alanyl-D-glutamate--2,6-diaminopimelate ligase [Candidatus Omnitrophota bacterium]HPD85099.1 UDP-N-acetylmuramoyl-L-alanyl-D-glutamate--2,6-diaminopimelate ligase [Candidatus Omnitrophota bacterium]HRZ03957.1 UDP-N-acetylmuramoyl-L-alanyl-D-glutamate--2,6-diaminopimelate ligase [Candidatus Omnitrophota bacterium]